MSTLDLDPQQIEELRQSLVTWFGHQQRDLPWRQTKDPYAIWLSEMMLQQTRVDTVIPYYHRFLERFPSITDLADASLDDVLSMWSGLGYYRRARHLHKAAQIVRDQHQSVLPSDVSALSALPGIGRYTLGAIRSIAFDQPQALVDGNVIRVFSRLYRLHDPVGSTPLNKQCWQLAEALVEGEDPGALNQALMELGAMVCTPKSPTCLLCPVHTHCQARATGEERDLPVRKAKKKAKPMHVLWAAVQRDDKLLLLQRPSDGLFADMWELPGLYHGPELSPDPNALVEALQKIGLEVSLRPEPSQHTHLLTHRRLSIQFFQCSTVDGDLTLPSAQYQWVELRSDLPALAIASITRKLLQIQQSLLDK